MRLILQRVSSASVTVAGKRVAAIGDGLMVLCGITEGDTPEDAKWCAAKLLSLRLWPSAAGKPWAESAKSQGFEVLLVSQFTLHAILKGNKPDFHHSMAPDAAKPFFESFCSQVEQLHPGKVQQGVFGASMAVELVNNGPVTLTLDSDTMSPHAKKKKAAAEKAAKVATAAAQQPQQQREQQPGGEAKVSAANGDCGPKVGPGGLSKKQAKKLAKKKKIAEMKAAKKKGAEAEASTAAAAASEAPAAPASQ